jgi:hypothetical protein
MILKQMRKEYIYIYQPKKVNLRKILDKILFSSKQSLITIC